MIYIDPLSSSFVTRIIFFLNVFISSDFLVLFALYSLVITFLCNLCVFLAPSAVCRERSYVIVSLYLSLCFLISAHLFLTHISLSFSSLLPYYFLSFSSFSRSFFLWSRLSPFAQHTISPSSFPNCLRVVSDPRIRQLVPLLL